MGTRERLKSIVVRFDSPRGEVAMGTGASSFLIFERPKPGQLAMWGSAAWAQTQLTPGVSVLAAPLQI